MVFIKTRTLYGVHVTMKARRIAERVFAAFFSCFFSWFFFFFFLGGATGSTEAEDKVPVDPLVVNGFGTTRALRGGTAEEGRLAKLPTPLPDAGESVTVADPVSGADPANLTFWCWGGSTGGGSGPGSCIIRMLPFWFASSSPGIRIRIVYTDSLAGNFPFEPVSRRRGRKVKWEKMRLRYTFSHSVHVSRWWK